MKSAIHPTYNTDVKVTCACGNIFETGSTLEAIRVDVCSKCHPFFTGQMRYVDAAGRVDKFKNRIAGSVQKVSKKDKRALKKQKKVEQELTRPTSLQDLRK